MDSQFNPFSDTANQDDELGAADRNFENSPKTNRDSKSGGSSGNDKLQRARMVEQNEGSREDRNTSLPPLSLQNRSGGIGRKPQKEGEGGNPFLRVSPQKTQTTPQRATNKNSQKRPSKAGGKENLRQSKRNAVPQIKKLTATKKKEGESTINAIIKRSMTLKNDPNPSDCEENQEYVPTMKEKFLKNQTLIPKYLIRHNDNFRMKWDIFIMVLAIWNCIFIPFDVAFEPKMPQLYTFSEGIVDFFFALDIIVAFRTTYINSSTGLEVVQPRQIAANYIISGRFFIDLAASIPFEDIYLLFSDISMDDPDADDNLELKLLGLLKLVRLLRLGRIIRLLKFKQGHKVGLRMIQLLFFLFLLVHWIACVWYLLVKEPMSWVPPKDLDYLSRQDNELWTRMDFYEMDTREKYATVFYYSVLTMVGNEISPRTSFQTFFSSMIIITGTIVSAFIFGNMAALMATMNKKSTHFDEQLDLVNTIMRQMKLPEQMQDEVVSFMLHVQNSPEIHLDLDSFFTILNDPLKKQILYHLHSSLVAKVDLFQKSSSVEQCFFISHLKSVLFLPKDYIIKEGEQGDALYFINKGEVSISITIANPPADDSSSSDDRPHFEFDESNQKIIAIQKDGQLFGEVALLTKLKRTASIVSDDYSHCAYLSRDDVEKLAENFPHLANSLRKKIQTYKDEKMEFRRLTIKNLHYLRTMNDDIVNEIISNLQVKRYAKGQIILKNGDISDQLMFLSHGEIDIKVTKEVSQEVEITEENELFFDFLNTGSCFCTYSFMCDDAQQLMKFVAKTDCIVESISREDFFQIAKKFFQLADKLDIIRQKFEEDETDFDFFRYKVHDRKFPDALKSLIRKKFRVALTKFIRRYKNKETDIPPALKIMKEFQSTRAEQQKDINRLRNTYAMSLILGDGEDNDDTEEQKHDETCPTRLLSDEMMKEIEARGEKPTCCQKAMNSHEMQDRMKALQKFSSQSTRVPDAKYSHAREKKILKKMEEEVNTERAQLDQQISVASQTLAIQKKQIEQLMQELEKRKGQASSQQ